jgi:hypothetical protein
VALSIKPDVSTKKTMLRVFFRSRKRCVLDGLPKGQKYDQDHFLQKMIPESQPERSRFACLKTLLEFATRMDGLIWHNGTKRTTVLAKVDAIRAPYSVYSPDSRPCDFWLFGMGRH